MPFNLIPGVAHFAIFVTLFYHFYEVDKRLYQYLLFRAFPRNQCPFLFDSSVDPGGLCHVMIRIARPSQGQESGSDWPDYDYVRQTVLVLQDSRVLNTFYTISVLKTPTIVSALFRVLRRFTLYFAVNTMTDRRTSHGYASRLRLHTLTLSDIT